MNYTSNLSKEEILAAIAKWFYKAYDKVEKYPDDAYWAGREDGIRILMAEIGLNEEE